MIAIKKNKDGLTPKMLQALTHAWQKQTSGQLFSLKDINGSKAGLINRDLLELVSLYKDKKEVTSWRVTKKGRSVIKQIEHFESIAI